MFGKQRLDAEQIVIDVGGIYADLTDQGQRIKPRSSLPCSWFVVRECFMIACEEKYLGLSEDLRNSFSHVYVELSFFVDDGLCKDFNSSLNIAVKCRVERLRKIGLTEREEAARNFIASDCVTVQDRKEIFDHLAHETTCPSQHLQLIAETLSYCGELHRAMRNEWAAFVTLTSFREK